MYYIYRITNKINGKTYIGKHKYKKFNDSYMGSGVLLKKAQKKYGIENFEKKVLVFNITKLEHANLLEETFIAAEREKVGRENCYNMSDGGDGGSTTKGRHLSEEHKRKIAESNKGRQVSEETRKKIAESNKGRQVSEETRKKLSEAGKNRHPSEETKRKMSESQIGERNHLYGKHLSEETKRKISEKLKDHCVSEETRKKIAEAKKDHYVSEETKRKISESKKERPSPRKGKKYVFYRCVETGETGTINDWSKRKFYHVNYGKSKGFTFIRDETVPPKTIKAKEKDKDK